MKLVIVVVWRRPPAEAPLHSVLVPTVDTVRLKFLLSALMGTGSHVLLVGDIGAGKTMVIASILEGLASNFAGLTINLSARTSSNALQDTIEGRLEKRTKVTTSCRSHLPPFFQLMMMLERSCLNIQMALLFSMQSCGKPDKGFEGDIS